LLVAVCGLEKISSTLRGEDKGEGDNYIADYWLLFADWKKFPLPFGERIKVRGR
jgi:hypothetical protein